MSQLPDLRNRLETAIRNNQQYANVQKAKSDLQQQTTSKYNLSQQQQKPSIKLKTDFSNFS
jgi:HEAT repeat-containing protein 5